MSSPIDGAYYKYYVGDRIEKYELPAYLNKTATKENIDGNFEEMPDDYKAIAIEKYRDDYTRSLATVSESFMQIKSPSLDADNCFSSVSLYEKSSLFDNSCSNEIKPWGDQTEFAAAILVENFNQASTGKC